MSQCRNISESLKLQVKKIVLRSRLALGLPDISQEAVDDTAVEIALLLDSGITEENLEEVYQKAMNDKSNNYALSYSELNIAFRSIQQVNAAKIKMPCPGCELAKSTAGYECTVHKV